MSLFLVVFFMIDLFCKNLTRKFWKKNILETRDISSIVLGFSLIKIEINGAYLLLFSVIKPEE